MDPVSESLHQQRDLPQKFFSKSLLSIRERLNSSKTSTSEIPSNVMRKRCFVDENPLGPPVSAEKRLKTSLDTIVSPKEDASKEEGASEVSKSINVNEHSCEAMPSGQPEESFTISALAEESPIDNVPKDDDGNYPLFQSQKESDSLQFQRDGYLQICLKPWSNLQLKDIKPYFEGIDELSERWRSDERFQNIQAEIHSIFIEKGPNTKIFLGKFSDEGPIESADEQGSMFQQWKLPNQEFDGMWQNLLYDSDIKDRLLSFSSSLTAFGEREVNPAIVSNNRVVLLYGPPGTGKTSLCKALAQQLSIRMQSQLSEFLKEYSKPALVEVNAHSLFSKWFSESGKLVTKLFQNLKEQLEDEEAFLYVLIDEVESLTSARKSALSGTEPSDSIRVVNSLLTQIDQLSTFHNVIIMTTSNITEAIDVAFLDRADIKQYIGLPSQMARYKILASCIEELSRTKIISEEVPVLPYEEIVAKIKEEGDQTSCSALLYEISELCGGASGRSLRKFPLITHALSGGRIPISLPAFLSFLRLYVSEQKSAFAPEA